jgi:pimeloyl-ACP methyl ester carboxylesterase
MPIAYQTVGDANLDLVLLPGAFSHVEHQWEEPSFARFLHRLASFSRLIVLDVRGTGLSDRAADLPTLEEQIDDVLAVLDAVGSERAALFGLSQGGGPGDVVRRRSSRADLGTRSLRCLRAQHVGRSGRACAERCAGKVAHLPRFLGMKRSGRV